MIHERNKQITLDAQILEIREQIRLGIESFPIDIVETIENDSQLYYELGGCGYWERYSYNEDECIIGYVNSNHVRFPLKNTPEPDFDAMFINIMGRIKLAKLLAIETKRPVIIAEQKPFNPFGEIMDDLSLNKEEVEEIEEIGQQEEGEIMVYLVELNDVELGDNIRYQDCCNDLFITEAERQENVLTIKEYQNLINNGDISMGSKLIRFI